MQPRKVRPATLGVHNSTSSSSYSRRKQLKWRRKLCRLAAHQVIAQLLHGRQEVLHSLQSSIPSRHRLRSGVFQSAYYQCRAKSDASEQRLDPPSAHHTSLHCGHIHRAFSMILGPRHPGRSGSNYRRPLPRFVPDSITNQPACLTVSGEYVVPYITSPLNGFLQPFAVCESFIPL